MQNTPANVSIVIACGGTGGHLFPGRAVAEELVARDCSVTLMISRKEVDQQAAKPAAGVEVFTLPAVGLTAKTIPAFLAGSWRSYRMSRKWLREHPCQAVLAMGGFTSAPPVLAGRRAGARAYLHESNTIPGRANRWLSRWVNRAFIGFPQAASRLKTGDAEVTGTPVRSQFEPCSAESARMALGLTPSKPVLLIMGGSQGASPINDLVIASMASFKRHLPDTSFLHLTGTRDFDKVRQAYETAGLRAVVRPFLTEMELAMDAADAAVSRAGASSLAEIAAMRLPSLLIPYPLAADDHQLHNARAYEESGAAAVLLQQQASPEVLTQNAVGLLHDEVRRKKLKTALEKWHRPDAAARIACSILTDVTGETQDPTPRATAPLPE